MKVTRWRSPPTPPPLGKLRLLGPSLSERGWGCQSLAQKEGNTQVGFHFSVQHTSLPWQLRGSSRARIPHPLLHFLLQPSLPCLPVLLQGPLLPGTYPLTAHQGQSSSAQACWVIQGATEVDYHLHKEGMVFHSHHVLLDIARHLSQTQAGQECTGRLPTGQAWLPGILYELLSSWVPGDCMVALGFSMYELSLQHLQPQMQQQPGMAPHRLDRETALPSHWLPVPPAKCSGEYGALWGCSGASPAGPIVWSC